MRCCEGVLACALAVLAGSGPATAAAQAPAQTDGGARPWVLGLAMLVDDASTESLLTSLNWGVAERTWLSFAAGRSRSPGDRAAVTARTLSAGIDHRFGILGVTFTAELWGDPDALESTDLGGSFYIQGERFNLAFERERRDIDVPFTLTGPAGRGVRRTVSLSGDATEVRLRIDLNDAWRAYLWSTAYDYSRDLSLLPRIDRLNLLSASTLTLANSFLDEYHGLGAEWEVGRQLVNFSVTQDRSAVDRSELTSFSASVLFPVAPRLDLEVTLGRSRSDVLASSLYGGLLLLIYGG